jgi:MFS family permease
MPLLEYADGSNDDGSRDLTRTISWALCKQDSREWDRRHKLRLTAAYCVGITVLGMVIGGIGPVIPGLGRQTGASLSELKYLFPSRAIGYVLGAIAGGIVTDKLPGAFVLAAASVGLGFFTFLAAMSTVVWLLCIQLAIVGFMAGILDTGLNTILVWIWTDEVSQISSL